LFAKQPAEYKNKVRLKNAVLKVAIEASNDPIWYKYVGENGLVVSVDSYHPSGGSSEVFAKVGSTQETIVKLIRKKLT
jgi:transketolase